MTEPPRDYARMMDDIIDSIFAGKRGTIRTIGAVVVAGILALGFVLWWVWG